MPEHKCYHEFTDEITPDEVYEGLLAYGLFTEKLPPIFTSEEFFKYCKTKKNPADKVTDCILYESMRNNNVPRQLAIPDPFSYRRLCEYIREYWPKIQEHIKHCTEDQKYKVSRIHIRKKEGEKSLFSMNYKNWKIDGTPEPDVNSAVRSMNFEKRA